MSQASSSTVQLDHTSKTVVDSHNDVAENYCRERMRVSVPGRMTYQKIFVRTPNNDGAKTSVPYNPDNDEPPVWTSSNSPTTEEQHESIDRPGTLLMLVVGLVIADAPYKYDNSGSLKGKEKEDRRQARGIIPRPAKVIRAVVEATKNDASYSAFKYYVAIDPIGGLCRLRLIKMKAIFFFPEFTSSIGTNFTIKLREKTLSMACRAAAAAVAVSEDVSSEEELVVDDGEVDSNDGEADADGKEEVESEDEATDAGDEGLMLLEDSATGVALTAAVSTTPDANGFHGSFEDDFKTYTVGDAESMF